MTMTLTDLLAIFVIFVGVTSVLAVIIGYMFHNLNQRINDTNQRIEDSKRETNQRIEDSKRETNQRIEDSKRETNRRFDDFKEESNKRFDDFKESMKEILRSELGQIRDQVNNHIPTQIREQNKKIEALEKKVVKLDQKIDGLKKT